MSIRTRIGLIVPATNSTAEPDFNLAAPANVSIHSQRMWNVNELTVEVMEVMNSDAEQAARYLAQSKVDLIVYACTTGSFFKGPGYDDELVQCIERAAGVPAVATAPAAAEALRSFGAKRISVASPYAQWQNDRLRLYYEAVGFEVLNVEGDPRGAVAGGQGHCEMCVSEGNRVFVRVAHPLVGQRRPAVACVQAQRFQPPQHGAAIHQSSDHVLVAIRHAGVVDIQDPVKLLFLQQR